MVIKPLRTQTKERGADRTPSTFTYLLQMGCPAVPATFIKSLSPGYRNLMSVSMLGLPQ